MLIVLRRPEKPLYLLATDFESSAVAEGGREHAIAVEQLPGGVELDERRMPVIDKADDVPFRGYLRGAVAGIVSSPEVQRVHGRGEVVGVEREVGDGVDLELGHAGGYSGVDAVTMMAGLGPSKTTSTQPPCLRR